MAALHRAAGEHGGGAVYMNKKAYGIISNVFFSKNSASSGSGGAISVHGEVAMHISSSSFDENSAHLYGGAIYTESKMFEGLQDTIFLNNSAETRSGGALFLACNGTFAINGSTFMYNKVF